MSRYRGLFPDDLCLWEHQRQGGKPLLHLRSRKNLAEPPMWSAAKYRVSRWMIRPPDVEAIRFGVDRRIAHGGECRERQHAPGRNGATLQIDALQSEPRS